MPHEKFSCTHLTEHRIETHDNLPINVKQYRYPQILKNEIERQIENMLKI